MGRLRGELVKALLVDRLTSVPGLQLLQCGWGERKMTEWIAVSHTTRIFTVGDETLVRGTVPNIVQIKDFSKLFIDMVCPRIVLSKLTNHLKRISTRDIKRILQSDRVILENDYYRIGV